MTKTKLQNYTSSVIDLKEGHAGILRRLTKIDPNGHYNVASQVNQTYKEYRCVSNSNQFTLSSDDLRDWKEIVIKPSLEDPSMFYWEGTTPQTQKQQVQPGQSSSWSRFLPSRVLQWFHKQKPAETTPASTTTIFAATPTNPATITTSATSASPATATPATTTTPATPTNPATTTTSATSANPATTPATTTTPASTTNPPTTTIPATTTTPGTVAPGTVAPTSATTAPLANAAQTSGTAASTPRFYND